MIVMSLPASPDQLEREVQRLEQSLEQLAERAVASGSLYAMEVSELGYTALRHDGEAWQVLRRGAYEFPDNISMIATDVRIDEDRDEAKLILLDPIGMPPRGKLTLFDGERQQELAYRRIAEEIER